ncbi:arginine/ornithine antiporter ArcD [Halostella salina]|uniref:arginine/ornithine antiporter ArcD n=1 Tax=Halostella salina TaxID=1547897 RepID=UPI000EF772A9|nr:Na+/H+ antiporter NhaC [Halostella salina]
MDSANDGTRFTFDAERRPPLRQAIVPVLGVVVFLGVGSGVLKLAPHGPLLWSAVLTGLVGRYWMGLTWDDLYDGIAHSLLMGMEAILILFVIYALIATWISAGTIPGLMYYGLAALGPEIFLPVTALLAAVVAFSIGSSWTTAGTLGVAFIGIGSGLGVPAPMTAGAILTGAYAGDKQSPLSDTTNLAAAVTDTDLYDHIRAMRNGTAVALGLSVVLYAVLGLTATGEIPAGRVGTIQTALAGTYDLSVLVFLPLIVTFGLALYGYPALPTLVAGVFAGVGTTVAVQGRPFTAAWETFLSGTGPETGVELVNGLLTSGGLEGSAWTIAVVVAALSLGGLLEATGVIATLAARLAGAVRGRASLVAGTGASAFAVNLFSAQQYMSIVVPGMTLRELYDEYGLDSASLSKAIESVGTPTGALIPWHAGGVYMAGVFGVATLEYAPYYFFAYLSPLVLFVSAAAGRGFVLQEGVADDPEPATADD